MFASVGVEMERPQTFPLEMKDKRSKGCALPSVCIKVTAESLAKPVPLPDHLDSTVHMLALFFYFAYNQAVKGIAKENKGDS